MQKAIYTTVGIDELLSHVQALKGVGARFVQMHAERNVDDGTYRLVYTFITSALRKSRSRGTETMRLRTW